MNTRTRIAPAERKAQILEAAVDIATAAGLAAATRKSIAERAGVSPALVSSYYSTMPKLRRAVVRAGVSRSILRIVADGLASGDSAARKAPPELRAAAAATLAG